MNKEWSEKNKEFQRLISKEATFKDGIKILLELHFCVFEQITRIVKGYSEKSCWLIDYWCEKDMKGLIKMPFSRHHIMHVEAMRRIKDELCKKARKGVDPIAYCGFSCNHCFLSQWCGSCRTEYNTCSFATCSPDGICPNTKCCKEKGFDGCWECSEIESCTKGFYVPECDGANAAKAQSLYIRKHGKKEFLELQDRLHKKFNFSKTQEILGQDIMEGLRILEEN